MPYKQFSMYSLVTNGKVECRGTKLMCLYTDEDDGLKSYIVDCLDTYGQPCCSVFASEKSALEYMTFLRKSNKYKLFPRSEFDPKTRIK